MELVVAYGDSGAQAKLATEPSIETDVPLPVLVQTDGAFLVTSPFSRKQLKFQEDFVLSNASGGRCLRFFDQLAWASFYLFYPGDDAPLLYIPSRHLMLGASSSFSAADLRAALLVHYAQVGCVAPAVEKVDAQLLADAPRSVVITTTQPESRELVSSSALSQTEDAGSLASLSKIASAGFVHTNGLGSVLCSLR